MLPGRNQELATLSSTASSVLCLSIAHPIPPAPRLRSCNVKISTGKRHDSFDFSRHYGDKCEIILCVQEIAGNCDDQESNCIQATERARNQRRNVIHSDSGKTVREYAVFQGMPIGVIV